MNTKYFLVVLIVATLSACSDDAPTSVEVEVTTTKIPAPPYMGKDLSFYRANADAFVAMREWCKTYVDSVRTDAQSKECGTVGHVHRTGGPTK